MPGIQELIIKLVPISIGFAIVASLSGCGDMAPRSDASVASPSAPEPSATRLNDKTEAAVERKHDDMSPPAGEDAIPFSPKATPPSQADRNRVNELAVKTLPDPENTFADLCAVKEASAQQPFNLSCIVLAKLDSTTYEVDIAGRRAVLKTVATEFTSNGRTIIPVVREGSLLVETVSGFEREVPVFRQALSDSGAFTLDLDDVRRQEAEAERLERQLRHTIVTGLLAEETPLTDSGQIADRLGANMRTSERLDVSLIARELSGAVDKGYGPLHYAVAVGNFDLVETLTNAGIDPLAPTRKGQPALHIAVERHRDPAVLDKIVDLMLLSGGSLDDGDEQGRTLAHYAVLRQDKSLLAWLDERGVNLDAADVSGLRPLHLAATESNDPDMITTLLNLGARPDVGDVQGRTPLHHVCETANMRRIDVLLDTKSDVNAADRDGRTPLHLACAANRYNVIEKLLEHGASRRVKDSHGRMPASLITNEELLGKFLLVGEVAAPGKQGWTFMLPNGDVLAGWCDSSVDCVVARLTSEGKTVWQRDYGGMRTSNPAYSPDGSLYVHVNHGYRKSTLVALAANGTERWATETEAQEAVIDAEGRILLRSRSEIKIISPDGELVQAIDADRVDGNANAIAAVKGTTYFPGSTAKSKQGLLAVDSHGEVQWCFTPDDRKASMGAAPVIGRDGQIYVGMHPRNDSGPSLFALTPTGKELWKIPLGVLNGAPLLVDDGTLYVSGQQLYAITQQGEIIWKWKFESSFTPILGNDGMLYAANSFGQVVKLTREGELIGQFAFFTGSGTRGVAMSRDGILYRHCANGRVYLFDTTLW